MKITPLTVATSAALVQALPATNGTLPIVDLGYVRQQASAYSTEGGFYNFSNIAFAQPPLGDLRFAAPQSPKKINGVQDGNGIHPVCPQAYPPWLIQKLSGDYIQNIPQDPSDTEDCLYLDVFAPKQVFDKRKSHKAPVLILIYGGGYVIGSKYTNDPTGLIERGIHTTNTDGAIVVAANYRVGNFGALGGSDFSEQGGAPNVGLLDQRKAIDWVHDNIHHFGGDATKVTLMGESGGASSISHQITGGEALGRGDLPFQQVIMQSPAEVRPQTNELGNRQSRAFLKRLNVNTLAEARKLDTTVLQQANYDLIQQFPTGVFPYTYNIDNNIVRGSARKGFLEGCAEHDVKAIISYNTDEGFLFTPDASQNVTFDTYVKEWLPDINSEIFQVLTDRIYPISAYANTTDRIQTFIADALVDCNTAAFEAGLDNEAWTYQFGMPSGQDFLPAGYHIQDLAYTYYSQPDPAVVTDVAIDMQTKFLNFVVHKDPNAAHKGQPLPKYSFKHQMLQYTAAGIKDASDSEALEVNERCRFWAEI